MKTTLSLVLVICTIAVYAQTNFLIPENKQNASAAGLYPAGNKRIEAAEVRALLSRQHGSPNSRALHNVLLDYDGLDELNALDQGGTYERFIWELNTNYSETDTNLFALQWAVMRVDSFIVYDDIVGTFVNYPRASSDIFIDSLEVLVTHENTTGTADTIQISIYKWEGTAGLVVNANDEITNQVLWDTLIITTTSLSPAPNQLTALTVYPELALTYPDNRFLTGVHFYGDIALHTFTMLAGYKDICSEACFATTSVMELNSLWRIIAWAGGTNLSGINSVAYNCDGDAMVGEAEECEEFPIQNWGIYTYMKINSATALVAGNVFHDANANCLRDSNETALKQYVIQADGANHYATTNAQGNYNISFADTGMHTLRIIQNHPFIGPLCPANGARTIHVGRLDTTYTNQNFAMEYNILCPMLEVDIGSGLLRPCVNTSYHLTYCNGGTISADSAYISVEFPSELTPVSGSIPWRTPQSGNTYIFDVGNLAVEECGNLNITVAVSCSVVNSQTLCVSAHIYPDSSCIATPAWDGSSVAADAACVNGDTVQFTITNAGSGDMEDSLSYAILENNWQRTTGKFKLTSGESINISLAGNGSTFRMDAEQSPGHPGSSNPLATVELCGTDAFGNTSLGFIVTLPQDEEDPFTAVTCTEVRTSYDPNDKTAFPAGIGAEKFISANTEIDYRIRFQNTGNDTAFKIVIRDTLTPLLDVTTVELGASSHPYDFLIYENSILEWTFDNILLPDSNVDEEGSHGFVQFRVAQKPSLSNGTVIKNSADIYFDFNDPVKTNVEFNTIGDINKLLTSIRNFDLQNNILVYPNPFSDFLTVEITGAPHHSEFSIFDLQGKQLRTYVMPMGDKFVITGLDLAQGMYFYRIAAEGKILGAGKLVK